VTNKSFIFFILTCERKMMAGGIRPARNTYRGVKKDMLHRKTTLYLQNMTVSFLHKNILFLCYLHRALTNHKLHTNEITIFFHILFFNPYKCSLRTPWRWPCKGWNICRVWRIKIEKI
jgi:hypothetical protein